MIAVSDNGELVQLEADCKDAAFRVELIDDLKGFVLGLCYFLVMLFDGGGLKTEDESFHLLL